MKSLASVSAATVLSVLVNDEVFSLALLVVGALWFGIKAIQAVAEAEAKRHED